MHAVEEELCNEVACNLMQAVWHQSVFCQNQKVLCCSLEVKHGAMQWRIYLSLWQIDILHLLHTCSKGSHVHQIPPDWRIARDYTQLHCRALLGLHAFTICDRCLTDGLDDLAVSDTKRKHSSPYHKLLRLSILVKRPGIAFFLRSIHYLYHLSIHII